MGYPMDYKRVVTRNMLTGDYADGDYLGELGRLKLIAGDLRRLEKDQLDEWHLKAYAEACNVSVDQARAVLEMFFSGDVYSSKNAPKTMKEKYSRS